MSCECINQGFFCREYWKDCPKCHGTGIETKSTILVRTIGIEEFGKLHVPGIDLVVLDSLYPSSHPSEPCKLHDWCRDNQDSYKGSMNFAYLNKHANDGIMLEPGHKQEKSREAIFFTHFPNTNELAFFSKYSCNDKYYHIPIEEFE